MVALADLISQHPAQADVVVLAVVVVDLEVTEAVAEDSVAVVADLEATEAVAEDSAEDAVDLEVVVVVLVIAAVVARTLVPMEDAGVVLHLCLASTAGPMDIVPMAANCVTISCPDIKSPPPLPICKAAAPTIASGSRQPDKPGLRLLIN